MERDLAGLVWGKGKELELGCGGREKRRLFRKMWKRPTMRETASAVSYEVKTCNWEGTEGGRV
jgi:hypothetical protein